MTTQDDAPGGSNATPKKRGGTYKDSAIIAALKASNGGVYLAAEKLGCDPKTIYRRAEKSEKVQQVIDNMRGQLVDLAEAALKKAVVGGEGWAVIWSLKTLGKGRGYVERMEMTGADGGPIATQQVFDHSAVASALAARSAQGGDESGDDSGRGDGETLG